MFKKMITLTSTDNSLMISIGGQDVDYIIPKGMAIAIQSDNTDTVDIKMIATRKTVYSLDVKDVDGYDTASELAEALQTML